MTAAIETKVGEFVLQPGRPGLRRHVRIVPSPGLVVGEVVDDYHHFIVELRHNGEIIHDVKARPLRYPWTICRESNTVLEQRLAGRTLAEADGFDAPTSHCTHQYDLALVSAAHAKKTEPVVYRMYISDPVDGHRVTQLDRNGEMLLDWTIAGHHIVAPTAYAGRDLKLVRQWAAELSNDLRWPARMLRRAGYIAEARQMTLSLEMTKQRDGQMTGACYSFQPDRMVGAIRNKDYVRDWSNGDVDPLGEETWRAL